MTFEFSVPTVAVFVSGWLAFLWLLRSYLKLVSAQREATTVHKENAEAWKEQAARLKEEADSLTKEIDELSEEYEQAGAMAENAGAHFERFMTGMQRVSRRNADKRLARAWDEVIESMAGIIAAFDVPPVVAADVLDNRTLDDPPPKATEQEVLFRLHRTAFHAAMLRAQVEIGTVTLRAVVDTLAENPTADSNDISAAVEAAVAGIDASSYVPKDLAVRLQRSVVRRFKAGKKEEAAVAGPKLEASSG